MTTPKPEEYLANTFWVKKMKTAFKMLDVDGDGLITVEDFKLTADRFEKKCPARATKIRETLIDIFTDSVGAADSTLTLDEWIKTRAVYATKPNARKRFHDFVSKEFDVIDTDQSGTISRKEFRDFFECKGLDVKFADASFDALDLDHNNIISREEFGAAGEEFRFGLDESHQSQLFFGPLVD